MSTIYALATPHGKAGLAVIRVSGPEASAAVTQMAGALPCPRRAGLRRLRDERGDVLDEAVVVVFPEGQSYTGETVVELQCHGSPAVVSAILEELSRRDGLRPAEAGEFTRRSLLNGRMDLMQVEGLADLLQAETDLQRRQAWRTFDQGASTLVGAWQSRLRRALALTEAGIDFSDQEVPEDLGIEVDAIIREVLAEVQIQIDRMPAAERLRSGYEVAIVGPPNSGKSTLFNYLGGRDLAMTSHVPGTTRDVLEVHVDVAGLPVTFLDTAGLRPTSDPLEGMGMERARRRANAADLRVFLLNGEEAEPPLPPMDGDIAVMGKADLRTEGGDVSGLTGLGVAPLLDRIAGRLRPSEPTNGLFNRHRHRHVLHRTVTYLAVVRDRPDMPVELAAEYLWRASAELGRLVGAVDSDDLLGDVFRSFCIGK